MDRWTLYTGTSIDSSPVSKEKRDVLLSVDKQWRIGIGAEYLLDSGRQLGVAYQYQNNGEAEINADNGIIQPTGDYSDNRIHFLTISYRY
nr:MULTISPECIES: outer membrane protein transport protein [unclassified Vibrio]